jgi:hypothetical protein
MGIRGEVFSTKVLLQNRSYFFNVKENRMGDLYLNIVESKNRDSGGFDRQSVILFAEDLPEFLKGFDESLRVLEKAAREKRRGGARQEPHRGEGRDDRADARSGGAKFSPGQERGRRVLVKKGPAKAPKNKGEGEARPRKTRQVRAIRREED